MLMTLMMMLTPSWPDDGQKCEWESEDIAVVGGRGAERVEAVEADESKKQQQHVGFAGAVNKRW